MHACHECLSLRLCSNKIDKWQTVVQVAAFLCLHIIEDLFGIDKLLDITVRSSHFSFFLANKAIWQIHIVLNVSKVGL